MNQSPNSQIILYTTEDQKSRIEVRLVGTIHRKGETVWLTQAQMADLFQTTKQNISLHIKNIFTERELQEDSVVKEYFTTASDDKKYKTLYYNLDAIIAVGYRVKSYRGTQFRIWATEQLKEYLIKGLVLDDERMKQLGGGKYFEELLERIRDIRSSEKVFWKKVLDLYATSVDYNPDTEISQKFFATVQNKVHWAAHGHTAAEIIAKRADALLPSMGLTSWSGKTPKKTDVLIAKNYLSEKELDALNRIVTAYLEFAELQAQNRRLMYMKGWIEKLDDFLKLSEHEILTHAGAISHEAAISKAETEYEKFHKKLLEKPSEVEKHFEEAVEKLKKIAPAKKTKKRRKK
ncbi:MAG: cell filamentation protein Fic [Ignavibacteria bacterium GWC2_35_8]|nr:MAG: cell filamentation protein Fic [Ignavibacteria bacterium GWC2_35_8]